MSELFDAVDALVASRATLPPPAERKRLRAAHGLTIDEVAGALKVRRATVSGWETGKTEPRPPERDAYARLLDQLAELYPAPSAPEEADAPAVPATFTTAPAPAEGRTLSTGPAPEAADMTAAENTQTSPTPAASEAARRPARTTRPSSTSRRLGAKKAAPAGTPAAGTDPCFENGPLAVVDDDGQVLAYCTGGLVLDVPAKSLPSLVDWTLTAAKLGAPNGPVSRVCAASEPGVARHLPVRQKGSSKITLSDSQRIGRVRPTPLIAAVKRLRARTEVCNRTTWAPLRLRRPRRHTRRALELPLTDVTTLRNPERTEVLQRRSGCVAARMAPRDARPTPAYYTPAIQEGAP